jgi:hypothetical protein
MGQKHLKSIKRVATKAAQAQALILAQSQIQEIANSPFIVRWKYCKAILFPKKFKITDSKRLQEIAKQAHGGIIPKE